MAKKSTALKVAFGVIVVGAAVFAYKRFFGGPPAGWAYANEGTGSAGWRAPNGSAFFYGQKSERPWANRSAYKQVPGQANNFSLTGIGATS